MRDHLLPLRGADTVIGSLIFFQGHIRLLGLFLRSCELLLFLDNKAVDVGLKCRDIFNLLLGLGKAVFLALSDELVILHVEPHVQLLLMRSSE